MVLAAAWCWAPPPAALAMRAGGGEGGGGGGLGLIKICGVGSAGDASLALRTARRVLPGADGGGPALAIGTVLAAGARRAVDAGTARAIAEVAAAFGATAVGVFVDEDAARIERVCAAAGLPAAQLHGAGARAARGELLRGRRVAVVDVVEVGPRGEYAPEGEEEGVLWRVFERAGGGGRGVRFDWKGFRRPPGRWALAGGLHPGNVAEAVRRLRPWGIDVSSGVAGPDGRAKDEGKLQSFLENAWAAAQQMEQAQ